MSNKHQSAFRSIAAPLDVDDAALDRLNAELGVPTLTQPVANGRGKKGRDDAELASDRAPLEKLTIELPTYLMDALRRAALLDGRQTVRYIVLKALQQSGFEVAEADLVRDGRRRRGRGP